jgi:hypothetical protein
LTNVEILPSTPPTLGEDVFGSAIATGIFTCDEKNLTNYRASPDWAPYFPFVGNDFKFYIINGNGGEGDKAIITAPCAPKTELATLNIPSEVMWDNISYPVIGIGDYAFNGYGGLTILSFPEGLTEIGDFSFSLCSGLTGELTLPASLTSIGGRAFYDCRGLSTLIFPGGLTTIGDYAFNGCSGLTTLTFPAGLTTIGYRAFRDCRGLTSIVLQPTTPPDLGDGAFEGISTACIFTCLDEALGLYQADKAWVPYFGSGTAVQTVVGGSEEGIVTLHNLKGQLLRRVVVTSSAIPSALRTGFGVPAGLYILSTPTGARKIQF